MATRSILSIEELGERLLAYMAKYTHEHGHQRGIRLDDVARDKWGINDVQAVLSALEGLELEGYARDMKISGSVWAELTAAGLARYENGGEVSFDSGHVNVDKSTTIYGPVSGSNIAINSQNVNQRNVHQGVDDLLDKIAEVLRHDTNISTSDQENALTDVDSLRRELAQTRPRQSRVRQFLADLGSISSISSLTIQLGQIVSQLPMG